MAHLDLVKKFGYRAEGDCSGLYSEVAGAVAEAGGGETSPSPRPPASLRACALAGVPVTLGSDAHKPEDVGYAFSSLVTALRYAGYTEAVRFKQRKRALYPLPAASK